MISPGIFIITGAIEGGKSFFLKDLSEFLGVFEKNIHRLISDFKLIKTDRKLVIVGKGNPGENWRKQPLCNPLQPAGLRLSEKGHGVE